KVCDRGDILALGQPHDPQQEAPAEDEQQNWAEIDGNEIIARRGRKAHTAKEGPRGAIDCKRQRIDQRPAEADPPGSIGVPSQGKQDTDVSERQRNDTPAFDHCVSLAPSPASNEQAPWPLLAPGTLTSPRPGAGRNARPMGPASLG